MTIATGNLVVPVGHHLIESSPPNGAFQVVAPDALTWDGQAWSGNDGTYSIWEVDDTGLITAAQVELAPEVGTAETTANFVAPDGYTVIELTQAVSDPQVTPATAAGDQIWVPAGFSATGDWVVTAADGTYQLYHVDGDGVVTGIEYVLSSAPPEPVKVSAFVSANLAPPADKTLSNLEDPIDPLLFDHWPRQPLATEELVSNTSDGYFDKNGNWIGDAEGVFPIWFIELDGTVHANTIDTTGLATPSTVTAETTVNFTLGGNLVTTVFADPIEPYLFEQWSRLPVAGEEIHIDPANGSIDQYGNLETDIEGLIDVYFTDASGVVHGLQIDSTGLSTGQAPVLDLPIEDVSATEGDQITINLDGYFTGADSYAVTGLPAGTGLSLSNGTLSGTLSASDASASPFVVSVTAQNSAGSVTDAFTMTIAAANVETYTFTAAIAAEGVTQAPTLSKSVDFGFAIVAEGSTQVFLSDEYDPPVIVLPATEITDGHSNADTAEIPAFQGCWHQLVFPFTIAGETIAVVRDAKFALFRGPDKELELTLNAGIRYINGTLYVELDETDTVDLIQGYQYELWIVDARNNPLFVRSGSISFKPTKVRF